jgi:apolipoprotein N-acyltransferase
MPDGYTDRKMNWLSRPASRALAAVLASALLTQVVNLQPWWPVAWVASIPLLLIAFSGAPREISLLTFLAAAAAYGSNWNYYLGIGGVPAAVILITLQALGWSFVLRNTRRLATLDPPWYAVFAFPLALAVLDTLISQFSPHSSFGSLAHSQGDALVLLQVASVFGAPAVVFLLGLGPSAVAFALWRGRQMPRPWLAYGLPVLLLAGSLGFGYARLAVPAQGPSVRVGLVAIDDFIGGKVPAVEGDRIWGLYETQIGALAAQGAELILLPEKIEVLTAPDVPRRFAQLAAAARRHRLQLLAGAGVPIGDRLYNRLWWFGPDGQLLASYDKQRLVPGLEAAFTPGPAPVVVPWAGQQWGLVICKDLHFPSTGRAYAQQGAAVVLDPAWDFDEDAWITARLSALRGIESGFALVRASRQGLLTVTDRLGRIAGEVRSAPAPGASLVVDLKVPPAEPTWYARTGDGFGWLCVVWFAVWRLRSRQGEL